MTTALLIVAFAVLFVAIETWPNGLDRRIRARQKAQTNPRKPTERDLDPRGAYVVGKRRKRL